MRGRPRKEPDEFAGITASECCAACTKDRCVIVEAPICGHPYKGSHPRATPRQTERIERARKIIAHQKVER